MNLWCKFVPVFDGVGGCAMKVLVKEAGEVAGCVEAGAKHEHFDGDGGVGQVHEDEVFLFLDKPFFGVHAEFFRKVFKEGGFGHANNGGQFVHVVCFGIVLQNFSAKAEVLSYDVVMNFHVVLQGIGVAQNHAVNAVAVAMEVVASQIAVQAVADKVEHDVEIGVDGQCRENVGAGFEFVEVLEERNIERVHHGDKFKNNEVYFLFHGHFELLVARNDEELSGFDVRIVTSVSGFQMYVARHDEEGVIVSGGNFFEDDSCGKGAIEESSFGVNNLCGIGI